MDESKPSATAIASAMLRAAHLFLDGEPKILRDEMALALTGAGETNVRAIMDQARVQAADKAGVAQAQFWLRAVRAIMVMRGRFVEDELASLMEEGLSQYVILGAGLDSFALRRRDLTGRLRVFEVDHPLTQEWKRERISQLNLTPPSHVVFVPVDFERQTLTRELVSAGYKTAKPGFFPWLGVTQYLTTEAIDKTLREVSEFAAGSEITLEYTLPESSLDEEQRHYVGICSRLAAESGEPWLSFFTPEEMSDRLERLGFSEIKHLTPEEAFDRYFAGRPDELPCPKAHRLITARV